MGTQEDIGENGLKYFEYKFEGEKKKGKLVKKI